MHDQTGHFDMTQNTPWHGKVAVVTGGSSGIGQATAHALAEQGARVLITGRNAERLSQTAQNITGIKTLVADSADPANSAQIVQTALDHWGRIDLVVNNAGAGHPMPMTDYAPEAIAAISNVNITAPSLLVHSARPALRDSQGAIVNISTALTQASVPMLAHYAATKAALEHLTRSWAIELAGDGIRVNAIAPGPVKSGALTGMMGLTPEMAQQVEAQEATQIPLGRRGEPGDIVPWILQLGSIENRWLTGQILTIDGGWSQRG
jgi:NAD(P)-dependent dehydrogenase (short-subunit alcohol dehydrogenase family)